MLVKAVELEIQKIEASQAKRHVQLLTAFLPESFVRRGGDSHYSTAGGAFYSTPQSIALQALYMLQQIRPFVLVSVCHTPVLSK